MRTQEVTVARKVTTTIDVDFYLEEDARNERVVLYADAGDGDVALLAFNNDGTLSRFAPGKAFLDSIGLPSDGNGRIQFSNQN